VEVKGKKENMRNAYIGLLLAASICDFQPDSELIDEVLDFLCL
jgi:hypothetical protein